MSRLGITALVAVLLGAALFVLVVVIRVGPAPEIAGAAPLASCDKRGSTVRDVEICLSEVIEGRLRNDPEPEKILPAADIEANRSGTRIAGTCHIAMHRVGRVFAEERDVGLEQLQGYLPRTNSASCSAGFSHGLLTGIGVDAAKAPEVARACEKLETRYQQYSCVHGSGHAFRRTYFRDTSLRVALSSCDRLGAKLAPDCAQGVFHDFWFAINGADDIEKPSVAADPKKVCRRQPERFVRPCWYRLFMEFRPNPPIRSTNDVRRLCGQEIGLQRSGCITAASAVASDEPFDQLRGCREFSGPDGVSCVRGVAVQALSGDREPDMPKLLAECAEMPDEISQLGCARWIGLVGAVATDGRILALKACDTLVGRLRQACGDGVAESFTEPLETFS